MGYRNTKGCKEQSLLTDGLGMGGGDGFLEDRTLALGHGRSLRVSQQKMGRATLTEPYMGKAWRLEGVYVVCFQRSSYHTMWLL